ncbi:lantibiotic dehydratase C-terminal domain-containing protein [Actinomadura harenae]|uniref:lantibiotic dehydratase C-terminal domain-containing protein n=1 Tax=Actinomadura harenae TaxID=2483351 RepID=UPI00131544A9|nr:lantibiotic dehydratase C-terminal domain-containing protein [Actinomadura harenae]
MTAWVSAHLFHAGDLDELITGLVAPLAADLAGDVDGLFFLRYWEGGPHLRLRLRPRDSRQAGRVRRTIEARARDHLDEHPSERRMTTGDYGALAARQARGERLRDHDGRLHPNDGVEFVPYRREHRAYGDAACMDAVEAHFDASSRLALGVLAARPGQGRRAALGLAALTLSLAACSVAPADLPAPTLPPDLDHRFLQRRDDLLSQTYQLWTDAPATPFTSAWSGSVLTLRDALVQNRCAPDDAGSPLSFMARAAPPERRRTAEVLLRCTHLLNNRLGIAATAEHRLALLAVRTLSVLHASGDLP